MARKLPVFQRVLGAPALFSVAYGEIASSIYFALGIIAGHALGLTPEVLLLTGLLFLVVALSYAEASPPSRRRAARPTLVRKAFNDLAGFCTGWVLFLDYLIVITLSALFLPHYLGGALEIDALQRHPWDVVVGVAAIVAIAVVRLFRRPGLYTAGIGVAVLDLVTQLLVVVLGLALLFSPDALTGGVDIGSAPSWSEIAFALPLAMLAYTGLETVANLAEEARRPGVDIPRSLLGAIGVVVVSTSRSPSSASPRSRSRMARPSSAASGCSRRCSASWTCSERISRRCSPTRCVSSSASRARSSSSPPRPSVSGFGRLAYSLGEHGMLPRTFGRLGRRTLISPAALVTVVVLAAGGLIAITAARRRRGRLPRGALQLRRAARVRRRPARGHPPSLHRPELERPYRVPGNVRIRGADVPVPAVVGLVLTLAVWVVAMITHPGAATRADLARRGTRRLRLVRRHRGEGLLERVISPDEQAELARGVAVEDPRADEARADRRGDDRDGGQARPGAWLRRRGAPRRARAAVEEPRRARRPAEEERAVESLEEARLLGEDHGVVVHGSTVRARSIGEAIVKAGDRAERRPHRARLGAALAQAVPLLLAHGRVRPPQRSLRGARRRVPRARARGGGDVGLLRVSYSDAR